MPRHLAALPRSDGSAAPCAYPSYFPMCQTGLAARPKSARSADSTRRSRALDSGFPTAPPLPKRQRGLLLLVSRHVTRPQVGHQGTGNVLGDCPRVAQFAVHVAKIGDHRVAAAVIEPSRIEVSKINDGPGRFRVFSAARNMESGSPARGSLSRICCSDCPRVC